jgi:hypothetical protein
MGRNLQGRLIRNTLERDMELLLIPALIMTLWLIDSGPFTTVEQS